jgi:hypothetical protein
MSKSTPLSQIPANNELIDDDDTIVQEVLQQISQSAGEPVSSPTPRPPIEIPSVQPPKIYTQVPVHEPIYVDLRSTPTNPTSAASMFDAQEARLAATAAFLFIIVQLVPVETFVFKYIPLDSLPHATIIIKALVAGALLYALRMYI